MIWVKESDQSEEGKTRPTQEALLKALGVADVYLQAVDGSTTPKPERIDFKTVTGIKARPMLHS